MTPWWLMVNTIKCLAVREGPAALPWGELGVDVVIESTGLICGPGKSSRAHCRLVQRRLSSRLPPKGDVKTIVLGVNDDDELYRRA